MKTELLHGTLDVMILKTLSWGRMHGYGVGRWIEQQGGEALQIDESVYRAHFKAVFVLCGDEGEERRGAWHKRRSVDRALEGHVLLVG